MPATTAKMSVQSQTNFLSLNQSLSRCSSSDKAIYNTDHKPYEARVLFNFVVICARENCVK